MTYKFMTHDMLTDRQQYAALAPNAMEKLMLPHINAEGSRLRLLPDDVVEHPYQDPFCFRYQGERQDIAIIDAVATTAEPRFPGIMKELSQDRQVLGVIDTTGTLLRGVVADDGETVKDRKSVWVITPHGDILDIAYIIKATFNLLDQQGYTPRRVIGLLSKGLGRAGFELSPGAPPISTVGTMAMQCDDVFQTWPRTKSAKKIVDKLPKTEVDRINEQASEEMGDELDEGGVLAAMAPTGTTRMQTDRTGALILPTPSKGTLELMMTPNTLVLPVPAWFQGEEAVVTMPTDPIEISEEGKAHEMLQFMAEVMTERVDGVNFVYKTPLRRFGRAALERHKPQ